MAAAIKSSRTSPSSGFMRSFSILTLLAYPFPLREYPEAITYLLDQWDLYEAEEIRLSDIILGFIDPNEEQDLAPTATHIGSELSEEELEDEDDDGDDDEDEEEDNSIDPEEAREKFGLLRKTVPP